jgi:lipopolysaccharide biosynthesis regulator YciM
VPEREGAVRFLEERLAARPEDAGLHVLHARALDRAGRRPEGYVAVRRALDLDTTGEVTFALRELMRSERAEGAEARAGPEELAARYDLLVAALLRRGKAPRCGRCGADAPGRTWRCRRCGAWDSFA